jgi:hypothetical protein
VSDSVLETDIDGNPFPHRDLPGPPRICAMCAEWQGPRRDGTDWGPCEYLSGLRDAAGYEIPDVDLPGYFGCGKWRSKAVME